MAVYTMSSFPSADERAVAYELLPRVLAVGFRDPIIRAAAEALDRSGFVIVLKLDVNTPELIRAEGVASYTYVVERDEEFLRGFTDASIAQLQAELATLRARGDYGLVAWTKDCTARLEGFPPPSGERAATQEMLAVAATEAFKNPAVRTAVSKMNPAAEVISFVIDGGAIDFIAARGQLPYEIRVQPDDGFLAVVRAEARDRMREALLAVRQTGEVCCAVILNDGNARLISVKLKDPRLFAEVPGALDNN